MSNNKTVIPECFYARAHARSTFREELDVLLRKCRESRSIDSRLKIAGMTRLRKAGFTLIELIIVVVIIGIVVAISASSLLAARVRANESGAQGALRGVQSSAIAYRTEQGAYPVSLAAMGSTYLGGGLEGGQNSGYLFELRQGNAGESYTCTAVPRAAGFTGVRSFCTDTANVIYIYDSSNITAGGVNCPPGGTALTG